MNEPIMTLVGNLTGDPELRYTKAGKPVTSFTVASTPRTKNHDGEWVDGTTMFVKCSVWDKQGEHCADSLHKGTRVIVTGRLTREEYQTRQGETRDNLHLAVDEIGVSLRFRTVNVGDASPRSDWETPRRESQPVNNDYNPPF